MPRLFLNFLFPLLLLQDGRFSVLRRFWMDSFFIYECGIKFLSFFSGRIFNVFIRIHSSNILPFRRLRALIFSVFLGRIQTDRLIALYRDFWARFEEPLRSNRPLQSAKLNHGFGSRTDHTCRWKGTEGVKALDSPIANPLGREGLTGSFLSQCLDARLACPACEVVLVEAHGDAPSRYALRKLGWYLIRPDQYISGKADRRWGFRITKSRVKLVHESSAVVYD